MSNCRSAVVALALLGCAAPLAHAQASLAWKLHKGDQFTLAITTEARDTVNIAGQRNETKTKMAVAFDVTVRETPRGGDPTLTLRFTSFEVEATRGDAATARIGKAVKGEVLSVTVDRAMKVQRFTGMDAIVRKVAAQEGAPPKGLDAAEKILAALFRYLLTEAFVAVPDKATERGLTWGQTTDTDFLGMGSLLTKKTYTDEGPASVGERKVRKVGVKAVLAYAPPKAGAPGLFPGTIDKMDLKNQQYKGTLYFDPEAGRPVSLDSQSSMDMTMTLTVNGMTINGDGHREQSFRIRFGEKKGAD